MENKELAIHYIFISMKGQKKCCPEGKPFYCFKMYGIDGSILLSVKFQHAWSAFFNFEHFKRCKSSGKTHFLSYFWCLSMVETGGCTEIMWSKMVNQISSIFKCVLACRSSSKFRIQEYEVTDCKTLQFHHYVLFTL